MSADAASDRLIQDLRGRIDEVDRTLLDLVNERLDLVHRIKARKVELGIDFIDPGREDVMLRDLQAANRGPLSDEGVAQLLRTVLELGKNEVYEQP